MIKIGKNLLIGILGAALLSSTLCYADTPYLQGSLVPGDTNGFYYEIGGGEVTPLPYTPDSSDIDLDVDANAGLGYNCGLFDPKFSIVNSLNNIKASFEQMEGQVIENAKGALLELPAYLIAEYKPELYKLMQDGISNGRFDFNTSTKSCQDMVSEIGDGKNPYHDWLQASLGDQWKYHMSLAAPERGQNGLVGSSPQDINQVNHHINQDNGKSGVAWVNGASKGGVFYAGGQGQPPILITTDTVMAGYNILIDNKRALNDKDAPPRTKTNARILDAFESPLIAAKWTVNVVGDQEITTYAKGKKQSIPGRGLLNDVQDETMTVKKNVIDLVTGTKKMTLENLKSISPPKIMLNTAVIQMLRKQSNPLMQMIYINKIAEEVAVARVIDKAKLALQCLEVGSQVPAIFVNHAAQPAIQALINRLRLYIGELRNNPKDNEEFVGKTIALLMGATRASLNAAAIIRPSAKSSPAMENGAVLTQ